MPGEGNAGQALANFGSTVMPLAASVGSGIFGAVHAKKAHKRNVKMWKKANRYNHPVQQMARLKEAGLNPNLIYGTSPTSAVGQAGPPPQKKAPTADFKIGDPLQAMAIRANIRLTKEAERKTANEADSAYYLANYHRGLYGSGEPGNQLGNGGDSDLGIAERESKKLDYLIKKGSKDALIQQAVQTGQRILHQAKGLEKDNAIKQYELDLIQRFGLTKAFVAIIISKILSR